MQEILEGLRGKRAMCRGLGDDGGAFIVRGEHGVRLQIIASWGMGWDHVSVSTTFRTPTWGEMCMVKDLFFHPAELALQYHPRLEDYVNDHPFCLHLWRPQDAEVPTPPPVLVGIKRKENADAAQS